MQMKMRTTRRKIILAVFAITALGTTTPARAQDGGDPTLYVAGYVDTTYAGRNQAATLLRRLRDASRKDDGLIRFEVLQRTSPINQFMIVEVWKDQAARDAHLASAHRKQFQGAVEPLLIAPIDDRLHLKASAAPVPLARLNGGALFVITHVDVPGANRDKLLPAITALADASRKEAGNWRFDVAYQKNRTNHFTVFEGWKDQKSNEAHEHAAHTKDFRGVLTPLTGAMYDQRVYKGL
jgi:quinol monooxygenase YgiN